MSCFIFDKSKFAGEEDLKHLHFRDDFKIDFNKNNVIFGCNAIGKTSISRFLCKKYPNLFYSINYEEEKEKIKAIKQGKNIELSADSHAKQEAENKMNDIENSINLSERIHKAINKTISQINGNDGEYFTNIKKSKTINKISLTKTEFDEINSLIGCVKKDFGNNCSNIFSNSHDLFKEVEQMQNCVVRKFCENYLNHLQKGEDKNFCPICGKEIDNTEHSLRVLLNDKINEFEEIAEPFFQDYLISHTKDENDIMLRNVFSLLSKYAANKIKIYEYLMVDSFDDLNGLNKNIDAFVETKADLESKCHDYELMTKELENIGTKTKSFIIKAFNFLDVKFDTKKKTLILYIPSERNINTYSQGELNLIVFMSRIIVAYGTDKKIILIDDPLSSFDLSNQYLIMHKICHFISQYKDQCKSDKYVTIFTHNPDALNIAKQYNFVAKYRFYYIENLFNELHLIEIIFDKNVIDIEEIIKNDSEYYLFLNSIRENIALLKEFNIAKDTANQIFHYNFKTSMIIRKKTLSNDALYNKIESWNKEQFSISDFKDNTAYKVQMLMSLRVFVEKKLFDIGDEVARAICRKEFGEKIKIIRDSYLSLAKLKYKNFDLDLIIEKKVMLNQNEHYKSQVWPYYYAMNISLDELFDEIETIKNIFN